MSRMHGKRKGGGRWANQTSASVPTSTVSAKALAEAETEKAKGLSVNVGNGGLRIEDPEVWAQIKRLTDQDPDQKVGLRMVRKTDAARDYQDGEKLEASEDDPFVIVGVTPDDPAKPLDYQVGDVVRKTPDGVEKVHEVDSNPVRAVLNDQLRNGESVVANKQAAVSSMQFEPGDDLLTRVAMGSDPLTPDQRWGAPRMTDDMVRQASVQKMNAPLRPRNEARVEAQAHPERWVTAPGSVCPRCGGDVPQPGRKGEWRGALSRTDNATEVCSPCGTDEAYEEAAGALRPQTDWPVPPATPRPSRVTPPEQVAGHRESWEDVRGGQRSPRQMTPTPKELPDLRLHLMEKWLPGGIYTRALSDSPPAPQLGVSRQERNTASVLDSEFHRQILSEASLWWVRDEMVDLVVAAAKTTPEDLRADELELPADQDTGMILLGKPYVGTDSFNPDMAVNVDVMCWGRAAAQKGKLPVLSLCMYRYFELGGGLSRRDVEEAVTSGAIYDAKIQRIIKNSSTGEMAGFLHGGSWVYVGRTDWPLVSTLEAFDAFGAEVAGSLSDMQKASMIEDRRFFASFCLLVNHKLSQVDEEPGPRHIARRMERELKVTPERAREISKVKIVRLRELKRTEGESAEDHEKRKVEWKSRWYSSGHWAWRWVGPRNMVPRPRRRVFVSGSIKGPKDLPIVFKETVRVWTR